MEKAESIAFGDIVRSYDFAERKDCYVEGEVIGFPEVEGCTRYAIRISRVVWEGVEERSHKTGYIVYPPLNGTPKSRGGFCNGVEKI